ncbi:glycoside hydrolase [Auricularia subglabra TFB-10046 SS5]|nr:glycoside hydrolase [Auricularia subglabra TFB-10046 SS5]
MKIVSASLLSLALSSSAIAANTTVAKRANTVYSGSNLYYAAGLRSDTRAYYLGKLQEAGVKVLRVWLDGQSGTRKGTQIDGFPGLEDAGIGHYDPTVLNRLDTFMVDAHAHGIKLMISMHSFNALSGGDAYGKIYGTGYFYEWANATQQFDNRLRYIMNHVHSTLGKPWKELSSHIFAFEAQNEAMIGKGEDYIKAHTQWQCDRANTIRSVIGSNSGILITTGGESWVDESAQDAWFHCANLDIIALHAYGAGDFTTSKLQPLVQKAVNNGKRLIMQEWGVCYYNGSNQCHPSNGVANQANRWNALKSWMDIMSNIGLSQMYWQLIPNADPHEDWDYEIGMDNDGWSQFVAASKSAITKSSPWDWSPYLL